MDRIRRSPPIPTDVTSTTGGGDWSATSTWNGGQVPASGQNVTIDGPVTLDTAAEIQNLTVNSGKTLTIDGTNSLTVNGTFSAAGFDPHLQRGGDPESGRNRGLRRLRNAHPRHGLGGLFRGRGPKRGRPDLLQPDPGRRRDPHQDLVRRPSLWKTP